MFRLSTLTLQPVLRLVRNPCYALPFFCLFFLSAILWQQVGYLPSASCTTLHSLQFPWRIQSLLQGQLGFKLVCGVISVPFALSFMYWGSVSVLDFFSFFSVISADYSFRMIDQQFSTFAVCPKCHSPKPRKQRKTENPHRAATQELFS